MSKKIKVLCFTDDAQGRDVEMLLPLRYFSERFLNCEFHHALNIDIHQIFRIKPDVILQANTIGSNLYFEISKIAHQQGIPIFALISEGNFRTDGSFDFWGFNKDKIFYQDYVCCWSHRTANFLKENVPSAEEKIVVTGGLGFDRYSLLKFLNKKDFLKKYNKGKFERVIGYAGWAFGKLDHKRGREELLFWAKGDKQKLIWIEEQRIAVRNILEQAIKDNPNTLFVLKQHPQENAPERPEPVKNEMSELASYDNVLYLCAQESIHDLISVSDFWTCFESTTALESWLMNKQTVFINPEHDFNRDSLYKGSALIHNYKEFDSVIKEFYSTGKIAQFNSSEKELERKQLIESIIGFGDGLNHIRAAYYFQKTLKNSLSSTPHFQFNFWHWLVYTLIRIAGPFYNRSIYSKLYKLKKHLWVFENYKMNLLNQIYSRYLPHYKEFYNKQNIEQKFKSGDLFKNLS